MAKEQKSSPLFILAAMLTALAAFYFAREILLPVALAILLSFLLTPLADALERWRFPRALAVVLVVLMSFAVLGGLGWIVTDQLVDMSKTMPGNTIKQNLANKTQWITSTWTALRKEAWSIGKLNQPTSKPPDGNSSDNSDGLNEKHIANGQPDPQTLTKKRPDTKSPLES